VKVIDSFEQKHAADGIQQSPQRCLLTWLWPRHCWGRLACQRADSWLPTSSIAANLC
jgi:hypothetical protein